jgi:hypothetical protein
VAAAFQQFPAFQFNFQGVTEEEPWRVVVFPSELRFKSKRDVALYLLAIVARDNAPLVRFSAFRPRPPRVTGLEFNRKQFYR